MKKLKRILLISCILVLMLSTSAFAENSVTYDGNANTFVFEPGSSYSPTDLFGDFKDVMPGDVLTEQIVLKNKVSSSVAAKVYLRSNGAQQNTDDFLSQLNLQVRAANTTVLFDAPANETSTLANWVYLGTIYPGGSTTLNLTLKVPVTLDSKYMETVGYIDWEFQVEEITIANKVPQTGLLWWPVPVLLVGGAVLIFVGTKKRKNETNDVK